MSDHLVISFSSPFLSFFSKQNLALSYFLIIILSTRTVDLTSELMCDSKKYPYPHPNPTHGRSLEIPRGRGLKGRYKVTLKIGIASGGGGEEEGKTKKYSMGGVWIQFLEQHTVATYSLGTQIGMKRI